MATFRIPMRVGGELSELTIQFAEPTEYRLGGEPIEEARARELLVEVLGPERAGELMPAVATVANKADAAWTRLQELRVEAEALGINVDQTWPIARLEQEIGNAS